MMKKLLSVFTILLCWGSVAIAYFYFQLQMGLPPCPLCILDRIVLVLIGVALAGMLLTMSSIPAIARVFHVFSMLLLAAGFVVGIRHVWLERAPHDSAASTCAPQPQIQNLLEFLTSAFIGTGDCAIVYWRLFGLSLADLTLILYAVVALLLFFIRPIKKNN